jgi:hypothetical protein
MPAAAPPRWLPVVMGSAQRACYCPIYCLALRYLQLKRGPEALQDAALCVTLKKHFPKGYYRFGCALEECKMYKESASVFAKVSLVPPPGPPGIIIWTPTLASFARERCRHHV